MIFGNLSDLDEYGFLEKNVLKALIFGKENNLLSFNDGKNDIEGDNLFFNLVSYETKNQEDGFYEAHKKYIDIHLMLEGEEVIKINFLDNMESHPYEEEKDFVPVFGQDNSSVILRKNDFLICYPKDAHMPGIKVNNNEEIKKAIFKVIIDN